MHFCKPELKHTQQHFGRYDIRTGRFFSGHKILRQSFNMVIIYIHTLLIGISDKILESIQAKSATEENQSNGV